MQLSSVSVETPNSLVTAPFSAFSSQNSKLEDKHILRHGKISHEVRITKSSPQPQQDLTGEVTPDISPENRGKMLTFHFL